MCKWDFANSNTKRTFRIFIVVSILIFVFIAYGRNGIRNDSYTSFLPLSTNITKVLTNVNSKHKKQFSNVSENGNASLKLDVDKPPSTYVNGDIAKSSTLIETNSNRHDQVENPGSSEVSNTDRQSDTEIVIQPYVDAIVPSTLELADEINVTGVHSTDDQKSTEVQQHGMLDIQQKPVKWNKFRDKMHSKMSAPLLKLSMLAHRQYRPKQRLLKYFFPDAAHFDKTPYDIMSMKPIVFDKTFKNPCWRGEGITGPFTDGKIHCLPYLYLIGVKKSGTTDFMSRLRKHPEFCAPSQKESQWFARVRNGMKVPSSMTFSMMRKGFDMRKVEFFSAMFDKATRCISFDPSVNGDNSVYYRKITAEASPSNFHMHTNWELWPGNENLSEPRYTNFHYIKHITPDAKIIVLFRDPVTRLYSDFMFSTHGRFGERSPLVFHEQVLILKKAYESCFSHSTVRSCAYNNKLKKELGRKHISLHGSFNAGFYAVFMRDLLSVFGNARILPIFMSDYVTKMEETLRNSFSFLDMSQVNVQKMRQVLNSPKKNVNKKKKSVPMFNETKDLLYEFYEPFNREMAILMNDSRYLFPVS